MQPGLSAYNEHGLYYFVNKHYSSIYWKEKKKSNITPKIVFSLVGREIQVPFIICGHVTSQCNRCGNINNSSPSRDKASRMLRQAVARSAMDCHSSSVESVVSDRTERELTYYFFTVFNRADQCLMAMKDQRATTGGCCCVDADPILLHDQFCSFTLLQYVL